MHSENQRRIPGRQRSLHGRAWLALCLTTLVGPGCVTFDDYPEGRLCKDPFRDAKGRAIFYPESAICPPELDAGPKPIPAEPEADGGAE